MERVPQSPDSTETQLYQAPSGVEAKELSESENAQDSKQEKSLRRAKIYGDAGIELSTYNTGQTDSAVQSYEAPSEIEVGETIKTEDIQDSKQEKSLRRARIYESDDTKTQPSTYNTARIYPAIQPNEEQTQENTIESNTLDNGQLKTLRRARIYENHDVELTKQFEDKIGELKEHWSPITLIEKPTTTNEARHNVTLSDRYLNSRRGELRVRYGEKMAATFDLPPNLWWIGKFADKLMSDPNYTPSYFHGTNLSKLGLIKEVGGMLAFPERNGLIGGGMATIFATPDPVTAGFHSTHHNAFQTFDSGEPVIDDPIVILKIDPSKFQPNGSVVADMTDNCQKWRTRLSDPEALLTSDERQHLLIGERMGDFIPSEAITIVVPVGVDGNYAEIPLSDYVAISNVQSHNINNDAINHLTTYISNRSAELTRFRTSVNELAEATDLSPTEERIQIDKLSFYAEQYQSRYGVRPTKDRFDEILPFYQKAISNLQDKS